MEQGDAGITGLGLPSDNLLSKAERCLPALSDANPLADGGEAIQVLIELGALSKAEQLLNRSTQLALRTSDKRAILTCQLLKTLQKVMRGDRDASRSHLERALKVAQNTDLPMSLQLLRGYVGVEVSLLWNDAPDVHAFLSRILEMPGARSEGLLQLNMHLWMAQWALQARNISHSEQLLHATGITDKAQGSRESTWKALRLYAEIALARGQEPEARAILQRSMQVVHMIAQTLPEPLRPGYLSCQPRQQLMERLDRVAEGSVSVPGSGVPLPHLPQSAAGTSDLLSVIQRILRGILELGRTANLAALIDYVVDSMLRGCGAQRGLVVLVEDGSAHVERGRHLEGRPLRASEVKFSRSIALQVAQEGEPLLLDDAGTDPRFSTRESVVAYRIASVLCVPLLVEGQRRGAIYLDQPERRGAFSSQMLEVAQVLASHAALGIEHARVLSKVIRDDLTGAFSFAYIRDHVAAGVALARRHGRGCAILVFDFDNFKLINDTYGHDFGNRVLQQTVESLTEALRDSDALAHRMQPGEDQSGVLPTASVARFGGDEFVIFLPEVDSEGLEVVGQRLLEVVRSNPVDHEGIPVQVSVSIGGACFPQHADAADALFRAADEALYSAKREGRNLLRIKDDTQADKAAGVADMDIDSLLLTHEGRLTLAMTSRIIESGGDLEAVLRSTLRQMAQAVGADRGFILVLDGDSRQQLKLALNMDEGIVSEESLPVSFGAVDRACREGEAVLVESVTDDESASLRESVAKLGLVSILVVPLELGASFRGVVYLDIRHGDRRFTREDKHLLKIFASRISPVLANARVLQDRSDRIRQLESELGRPLE